MTIRKHDKSESNRIKRDLQKSDVYRIDFKESLKELPGIKNANIENNNLCTIIRKHDKKESNSFESDLEQLNVSRIDFK